MTGLPIAEGGAIDVGRLLGSAEHVRAGVRDQGGHGVLIEVVASADGVRTGHVPGDHVDVVLLDKFAGLGQGNVRGCLFVL